MKLIKSILLLFVLMLPLISVRVVFHYQQKSIHKSIKKRIKKGVKESDLVLLKIPVSLEKSKNNRFKRIHSREFCLDGEMYDIVRQELHTDTTYYWCIWDKEETALFARLDQMVSKALGANPEVVKNKKALQHFYNSLYFQEYSFSIIPVQPGYYFHLEKTSKQKFYTYPPPLPPPRLS
ncbi:MAG: hypothetical protein GX587_00320 [Bacteroidales bacterium]|nr:hypothetical protein [Bacteroidales bacterium]